jgi:SMI1-KNR4 cell-wall
MPKKTSSPTLSFVKGTSAGKFSAKYIAQTEEMLNLTFEPAFLDFLKSNNGGSPKKKFFPLGKNVKVVQFFLSLVPNYQDSPFGQVDIGVVWSSICDRLNDWLIPFAAVHGGDFLCFNHKKPGAAQIVLWDHEKSREAKPKVTVVADSWAAFLVLLTDDESGKAG